MNLVTKYNKDYDEDQLYEIRYGLEGIYLSITKIIVIFFLAYILGVFTESVILTLFFNGLRFTGFGIHASKSYQCWISSSLTFLGLPLLCKYYYINYTLSLIISIVCIISFILYAPADTYKRPLIYKKRRIIYKISTVIIGFIYTYISLSMSNQLIHNTLLCAMVIETVLIHPLTYRVFKLPYKNYKTYVLSTER